MSESKDPTRQVLAEVTNLDVLLSPEEKLWIAVIQKAIADYINFDHFSRYERGHIANIRERKQERVKNNILEENHRKAYDLLHEFIFTDNHANSLANILRSLPMLENPDCAIHEIRVRVEKYKNNKEWLCSFTGIIE